MAVEEPLRLSSVLTSSKSVSSLLCIFMHYFDLEFTHAFYVYVEYTRRYRHGFIHSLVIKIKKKIKWVAGNISADDM